MSSGAEKPREKKPVAETVSVTPEANGALATLRTLGIDATALKEMLMRAASEYKNEDWAEGYSRLIKSWLGREINEEDLSRLLKNASAAHHIYEQGLGHADEDWAGWYAEFILAQTA